MMRAMRRAKNYHRRFAAYRVCQSALKAGRLRPPKKCQRCHQPKRRVHAHHDDYARPLDVQWLCSVCHQTRHAEIGVERERALGTISSKAPVGSVGARIAARRTALGWPRERLALLWDIALSTTRAWELGLAVPRGDDLSMVEAWLAEKASRKAVAK